MCIWCVTMKRFNNSKRVQVSFTGEQWQLIKQLEGEFGSTDADIVRNLVLAWLAEKSFISSSAKKKIKIKK